MRWPFGGRSTPAGGATSPSAAGGRAAAERPHDAWRSLPAVQRLVGDPPVVAPAAPFAETLATRQPAGLALAPLGHEVSSLATPGLLIGTATATGIANTAAVSGRPDLPLQRRFDPAGPTEPAWSSFEAAADTIVPGAGDRRGGENLVPAPVATIQRLAAPAPLLTSASDIDVRPAPAGRLDLRLPAIAPGALAAPAAAAPALPVVQRAAPAVTPGRPAAEPQIDAAATLAPARRPTLGEARRLGLGAPLRSAAEMKVQRSEADVTGGWQAGPPVVPANASGAMSVQAHAEAGSGRTGGPAIVERDGAPSGEDVAEPDYPAPVELTVVQPLSVDRRPSFPRLDIQRSIASPASTPGPEAASLLPGAGESRSPAGPVAIADPFPLVVARSATGDAGDLDHPQAIGGAGPSALPPSRTSLLGGSPIRATSRGSLLRAPAGGPAAPGRDSGAARPPSGGPVVARVVDGGASSGVAAQPMAGQHPMAAELAALGITIHREPAGPVVQRRSPAEGPAPEPGSSAPGNVTIVPLQRAVEIGEVQVASSVAGGQAGAASGSTAVATDAAGSSAGAATRADRERELDELARRLYGRIRSRLASELLADRERAGLLVDLR